MGAAVVAEWDVRAAYAVAVATSIGAFLLVALLPDLTAGHERATAAATRRSVGSVLLEHRRTLLTLGTGVLAIAAARGARTSLLPLWAEHIGLDAQMIVEKIGADAMRLTVTDVDPKTGKTVVTSRIDLNRS